MSRIPVRSPIPSSREGFDLFEAVILIFLIILPGSLAVAIPFILVLLEGFSKSSGNRQVILDVPESSRVDAQVTSGDNTVNLQNL